MLLACIRWLPDETSQSNNDSVWVYTCSPFHKRAGNTVVYVCVHAYYHNFND